MKIGTEIALGLQDYDSALPPGSTVAVILGDPAASAADAPRLVSEGVYDVAITTPAWYAALAAEGRPPFAQQYRLAALAVLPHDDYLLFAVRADSEYRSIRDLVTDARRLRISTPPPASRHPTSVIADLVLARYGSSVNGLQRRGARILADRPVDQNEPTAPVVDPSFTVVIDEAVMTRRWTRMSETYDLRLLALEPEVAESLRREGVPSGIFAAGRLPGLDQDVLSVALPGYLLFCRSDWDDELVELTLEALEKRAAAVEAHFTGPFSPLTGPVDLRLAARETVLPLHRAAERFYRDHGYL